MTSGLGQHVGRHIVYLNLTTKSVVFCGDFVLESAYPRRACMRSPQELKVTRILYKRAVQRGARSCSSPVRSPVRVFVRFARFFALLSF